MNELDPLAASAPGCHVTSAERKEELTEDGCAENALRVGGVGLESPGAQALGRHLGAEFLQPPAHVLEALVHCMNVIENSVDRGCHRIGHV